MRKENPSLTGWHPSAGNKVHVGPIDETTRNAIGDPVAAKKARDIARIDGVWGVLSTWSPVGEAFKL